MNSKVFVRTLLGSALALATGLSIGPVAIAQSPLGLDTARITIAGTSNIHDYTATTTTARVTRVQIGAAVPGTAFWEDIQKPGGLEAFEITIAAASLKSSKDGLDKNMYKALKVKEHADITFRLGQISGEPGALKATGLLTVAGVEREVVLALKTERKGSGLSVTGEANVLMTDFGIAPPKAMMGMVKADPKIKVTFEVVLGIVTT
jgi:hypothetical protein